jgi:hypothetical protein
MFATYYLRLAARQGDRYRTVATRTITVATPQQGHSEFCGLRVRSVGRDRASVAVCVTPTASVGRVTARYVATRHALRQAG